MKILIVDVAASNSGALSVLNDFFRYIDTNHEKHDWYFILSVDCLNSDNRNINIIKDTFPKKSWIHRIIWDLVKIQSHIKAINPNIILSLQNTIIFNTAIPQIIYLHQSFAFANNIKWSYFKKEERIFAIYKNIYSLLIKKSVRKAKKVIVQTEWMRTALIENGYCETTKINVIPPSINMQFNKKDTNLSILQKDTVNFIYPSQPLSYKNFEIIVNAAKILAKKNYKFRIIFTIRGDENIYATRIKESTKDITKFINFIGIVSRETLLNLYKNCILVFPSLLESFGLPLLEARCMETQIIASDMPFSREILEGYNNVKFFDPYSVKELYTIMEKVIAEEFTYCKQNTNNINSFMLKFSDDNTWGKVIRLLEDEIT